MRKFLYRFTPALLAGLMLAGCGGETSSDTPAATTATAPAQTETEAATTNYLEIIGKHDFKGRDFTVVYSADQLGAEWPYHAEELNGEVLNDAVFNRDKAVEDNYNAKIGYFSTGGQSGGPVTAMNAAVLAGDEAYQLCVNHMYSGFNAAVAQGTLYDFNKMPVIDTTQPWWNQTIRENLQVGNVLLTEVSDFVYAYYDVFYFNKEIMKDNGLPYPYEQVRAGTWTWDYVNEVTEKVSKDVNGDGQWTKDDLYGYIVDSNRSTMTRVIHANGMTMATVGADGKVSLAAMKSDKMQTVIEKYYTLIWEGHRAVDTNAVDECVKLFHDKKGMFLQTQTTKLALLRDAEFEFGIVPLPKYDEKQEGYYSMASSQMLLLPADMKDTEFVGTVTEALAYEAHMQVTPALFDVVYENKLLRDEDSQEMFDIIRGALVYDFNWIYGNGNAMAYLIGKTVGIPGGGNKDFASYYATNIASAQKVLDDVVESILKNYGK